MLRGMLLLPGIVLLVVLDLYDAAPGEDVVETLPGLKNQPRFKHYSGYLNASGTKRLHYWFMESQNDPKSDPVVVWMNGGPGCSSMEGLITENGPFLVSPDGSKLHYNPYSWNMVANVLYLESPAGVGYSYSQDRNYTTNDDETSYNNHLALQSFFKKFPEYKKNEFYLTGESYSGFYLPCLAVRLMNDSNINLKGLAIGNGLSSLSMNDNSMMYFLHYHTVLGDDEWSMLQKYCCNCSKCEFSDPKDAKCRSLVRIAAQRIFTIGINEYDILSPCADGAPAMDENGEVIPSHFPSMLFRKHAFSHAWRKSGQMRNRLGLDSPCTNTSRMARFMNNPAVRKALHIEPGLPAWVDCSDDVHRNFVWQYEDMRAQHLSLLKTKKYRILLYNGDQDMMCNYLGDQWFVESLQQKLLKSYHPWYYEDKHEGRQIGGFVKYFTNLSFLTLKGAGHMSPKNKPQPAFYMITHFLKNQPF